MYQGISTVFYATQGLASVASIDLWGVGEGVVNQNIGAPLDISCSDCTLDQPTRVCSQLCTKYAFLEMFHYTSGSVHLLVDTQIMNIPYLRLNNKLHH